MTPTETTEKAKLGRPRKNPTAMVAQTGPDASITKAIAAKAAATIFKVCKQKPLQPSYSTMPHLPSGSTIIDLLIGGSKARDGGGYTCPGYPRRRITEVYGAESSGKTTIALAAIADCQRKGGVAMFLDFEHALHHGYAKTIGVDFSPEKLLYYQPDTLEEGVKMLYLGIRAGVDLIVLDSVAAMVPLAELAKELGKEVKVGALAKAMSELLPKLVIWLSNANKGEEVNGKPTPKLPGTAVILINQTRAVISIGGYGGGGGPQESSSGGKALKYFTYVRLGLQRTKSYYIEKIDSYTGKKKRIPIGNLVQVKAVKTKCDANQGQAGEIFIRYGFGLDDILSLIEAGVVRKIVGNHGSMYDFEGENFKGKDSLRKMLLDHPQKAELLKTRLCESLLENAPQAADITDEDEVLSDMRANIGDDDVVEGAGMEVEEATEEVTVGES